MIHFIGLMSLFAGASVLMVQGKDGPLRKQALIFHGLGLVLLLVGGFGALALMKISYTSGWVLTKIGIWLFFGVAVLLAKYGVLKSQIGWLIAIAVGAVAAWLGINKPF